MEKYVFKASEIRYLWKHRGSKDYELKYLKAKGNSITSIIFEDIRNGYEVSGKLVASPREGEAYHWPRLQHKNLAPLLEVVSINEKISMYMSIIFEKSLTDIIHEDEFLRTRNCFERKKSYAEDILWGLDYLHNKHLCLMNLNEANIYICTQTDKAIISDFSFLTLSQRAKKRNVAVIPLYRAPEVCDELSEYFDAVAAEMWTCGVMMLQIFTGHAMPEVYGNYDVLQYVLTHVGNLHLGVLVQANMGALITSNILLLFKEFLDLFLSIDPNKRCSAKAAALSPFLVRPLCRFDQDFGKLWQCYSPQTSHYPEKKIRCSRSSIEFNNKNKLNEVSRTTASCPVSKEAADYKDRLKVDIPWNKFINLEHVSNEQKVRDRNLLTVSPHKWNCKQIYQIISNKHENVELQENQAKTMDLNNMLNSDKTSEIKTSACQMFESIYSACDTTKNNSLETIAELKELNSSENQKDSENMSDSIPFQSSTPSRGNENLQAKVNSRNDFYKEICNERKSEHCISNIVSSENSDVIYNILDGSDKLLSPLRFSPTSSVKNFQTKWNVQEELNNLSEDEKNDNLLTDYEGRDYTEIEETYFSSEINSIKTVVPINKFRSKNSLIKEHNQDNLACSIIDKNEKDTFVPCFEVKQFRYDFCKNYVAKIKRSHSESSINFLTSNTFSLKKDPCCVSCPQLHLLDQYRNCHLTLSSADIRIPLSYSREITSLKTEPTNIHEINEKEFGNYSSLSFWDSSSFLDCDINQNQVYHADNFETDNYITEILPNFHENASLVPQRPRTGHPILLDNIRINSSKSETSLHEQKKKNFRNFRSEISLEADKKLHVLNRTRKLTTKINFYNNAKIKIDSKNTFKIENCCKDISQDAKNKTGNESIIQEKFCFNRRHSYACAMMHSLELSENKCAVEGYHSNERIQNNAHSIENKLFPNFICKRQSKSQDKTEEHHKKQSIQTQHDISEKPENAKDNLKHPNERNSKKSECYENKINEIQVENFSFTDIPLNSSEIPEFVGENVKSKKTKKSKRKKSWFRHLCPGCKVYYDDKEELFAETP
ncbi:protein kinase domain-containing protein [Nephila pilipes]|uniref:non-specific serine/threonine protein kinase n=1 Tax=Nephila pilipes TaxID=299642 RepID=A0A8X6PQ11_NEPPI|nr:protein kinase domain-containing protein [Nephila pilipes]